MTVIGGIGYGLIVVSLFALFLPAGIDGIVNDVIVHTDRGRAMRKLASSRQEG